MYAKFCKILISFSISSLLYSCEKKQDDRLTLVALQAACIDKWANIEHVTEAIERKVIEAGRIKADVKVLELSKRVAGWKYPAVSKISPSGLNRYIDSISAFDDDAKVNPNLKNSDWEQERSSMVFQQIQTNQEKLPTILKTTSDSVQFYGLLFLGLSKELQILTASVAKLGVSDRFISALNKKYSYQAGDTVKILVPISVHDNSTTKFVAKNIEVSFNEKPLTTPVATEFIGGFAFFKFTVPYSGTYHLNGQVISHYPESGKKEIVKILNEKIRVQ